MPIFTRAIRAFTRRSTWIGLSLLIVAIAWFTSFASSGTNLEMRWIRRAPLLMYVLWLPALWIALSLRTNWPFFGPGDEGLAIVRSHAAKPLHLRVCSCLGILSACVVLYALTGLLLGCTVLASDAPAFRVHQDIAARGDRYLAATGDGISFELPATADRARIRAEPISGFGTASLKAPTEYELRGPTGSVYAFTLRESLDTAIVDIDAVESGTWKLVRTGGRGTASDFLSGILALENAPVNAILAGCLAALALLPFALAIVGTAIALARFVEPTLHFVTVLLGVIVATTWNSDFERFSDLFARGAVPAPAHAWSWGLTATLVGAIAFAIVVPYRHSLDGRPT